MRHAINPRQALFCREYVKDFNATQAAIRAGYSKHTATKQGSRLLTKIEVQKYIEELKQNISVRHQVDTDWIVRELVNVVEMGLGKRDTDVVVKESMGAGMTETVTKRFKKADLNAVTGALQLLARYNGMFEKDNAQSAQDIKITLNEIDGRI